MTPTLCKQKRHQYISCLTIFWGANGMVLSPGWLMSSQRGTLSGSLVIAGAQRRLPTVCGVSLYMVYSYQALAETERQVGPEDMAHFRTSFGWSLGLAWLSYGLELLTGVLLLAASRLVKLQHSSPTMA